MKIQVGGLSEGVHEYRFSTQPAEIGLGDEFRENVDVRATLEKISRQFFLKVSAATAATVPCDRCVAMFRLPVESRYRMHYVWEESEAEKIDPSEFQVMTPGQTIIDLTEDVRQVIEVALPLKHVCREDCRGLCPQCGKNLNEGTCECKETRVDGRWDKLKELRDNIANKAG